MASSIKQRERGRVGEEGGGHGNDHSMEIGLDGLLLLVMMLPVVVVLVVVVLLLPVLLMTLLLVLLMLLLVLRMMTMLLTWLYLERRSDLQGAPVLIWPVHRPTARSDRRPRPHIEVNDRHVRRGARQHRIVVNDKAVCERRGWPRALT